MTPEEVTASLNDIINEAYSKLDSICKTVVDDRSQLHSVYCVYGIYCITVQVRY